MHVFLKIIYKINEWEPKMKKIYYARKYEIMKNIILQGNQYRLILIFSFKSRVLVPCFEL